jgi:DNA-binding MarR family transcriptional regulator/ribosomal protein S18 acetylase RimI-like enzyme
MESQIKQVRRFNRAVSLRIGALSDSFLDLGRPFGEARLIYEIGLDGAEVRDLRRRLGLDSGYVSRLLRALERQDLVSSVPAPRDGRVRLLTLTDAGRAAYVEIDAVGDAFAARILAPLDGRDRARMLDAMSEVERLMRAFAIGIALEPAGSVDAETCLTAYYAEIAERFETGFDPAVGLPTGVEEMTPPKGLFLMARLDGEPIGCGALLIEPGGVGHIRRMWISAEQRGLGLGRRMLTALEDEARDLGLDTVRLETNRTLAEAQALFRSSGYREVAPFNNETYAHHWFEKRRLQEKEKRR